MSNRWRQFKRFLLIRVLHADDPPHKLALGFGIGVFVAMTPTIGIQMVLAAALAAVFRANKILAATAVWISNPVTMVYIYYMNWRIGQYFVETSMVNGESAVQQRIDHIITSIGGLSNLFWHLLDKAFWSEVLRLVWSLGVELWIGSFIVGAVCALPAYVMARWGIVAYRHKVPRPKFFLRSQRRRDAKAGLPGARPQLRKHSA